MGPRVTDFRGDLFEDAVLSIFPSEAICIKTDNLNMVATSTVILSIAASNIIVVPLPTHVVRRGLIPNWSSVRVDSAWPIPDAWNPRTQERHQSIILLPRRGVAKWSRSRRRSSGLTPRVFGCARNPCNAFVWATGNRTDNVPCNGHEPFHASGITAFITRTTWLSSSSCMSPIKCGRVRLRR